MVRLPDSPPSAPPHIAQIFSRASEINGFEMALQRHAQRLPKSPASAALFDAAVARIDASAFHLKTEIGRLLPLLHQAHSPYLLHLRAWLEYRVATKQVWEKSHASDLADSFDSFFEAPASTLRLLVDQFPRYRGRHLAALQLAHLLGEVGRTSEALQLAQSIACPNGISNTTNPYAACSNQALGPDLETLLWVQIIGMEHSAGASDNDLELAVYAYQKAIEAGGGDASITRYQLGKTYYRLGRHDESMASFFDVLGLGESVLKDEALAFLALLMLESWQASGQGPLVAHVEAQLAGQQRVPYSKEVFSELLELTTSLNMQSDSLAIKTFMQSTWP